VTNYDSHDISLYRNRGDGTFLAATRVGGIRDLTDALLADFTGDGIVDALLAGNPWVPSVPPSILLLEGLGNDPWTAVGSGIAGTLGLPHLDGDGAIVAGNALTFRIDGARPNSTGVHLIGLGTAMVPALGGVLVPVPTIAVPFATDGLGHHEVSGPLPADFAGGFEVVMQSWIFDAAAKNGVASATAGIRASAP
jgi:hypothetical protein